MAWDFYIIGADAAGLSAAVQIKRLRPEASLKIINKGMTISYAACGIPYVISGDIPAPDNLIHFTPESLEKRRGIHVDLGQEAVGLFPDDRAVEIKNVQTGEVIREEYGRVLIATGASARRLPFLDYGEEGIFSVHTIEDLVQILAFLAARQPKRAAIIGAGNIGLEMTEALRKRGLDVLLIEVSPVAAGLWPPLVRLAVLKRIQEQKINLLTGVSLRNVERTGRSFRLETSAGIFEADVIFTAVGTAPATGFCRSRVEMEDNGAIKADKRARTSSPDVYAAGDCATVYHKVLDRNVYFPLGSTANKMGRIAGINMAGGEAFFPGIVGTQIMKFFDLSLARTGLSLEEAQKEGIQARAYSAKRTDKSAYYPGAAAAEVEVVCEETSGKIIGAAAISQSNAAQFIDPAAVAVFMGMSIQELGWFDSAYAPPFAPVWNALISAALKASTPEE